VIEGGMMPLPAPQDRVMEQQMPQQNIPTEIAENIDALFADQARLENNDNHGRSYEASRSYEEDSETIFKKTVAS
jgi:hypothetical protein